MVNVSLKPQKSNEIAFQLKDKSITYQQFWSHVTLFSSRLAEKPDDKRYVLSFVDGYSFAVALFGVIACGCQPILLPNNLPATRERFSSCYDVVLSECDVDRVRIETPVKIINALNLDQKILLFTSGSTDQPKEVITTLKILLIEAHTLEHLFSAHVFDKVVYSTVSHQHIYGLLYTVIWPLYVNRTVCFPVLEFPEDIENLAHQNKNVLLISSPALLKRLSFLPIEVKNWSVFSSGGLLKKEYAERVRSLLGCDPIEVFGSTETGGVAYRQQMIDDVWQLLPNVMAYQDKQTDRIVVESPFFYDQSTFVMGDKVDFISSGKFKILGRIDQIAKIEEKRVSLTEMEHCLNQHEYVNECRIIVLESTRQYLAAVIILSEEGNHCLSQCGKLEINKQFQSYLALHFERVVIPKKFRYQEDFPLNAQGKTTHHDLEALF